MAANNNQYNYGDPTGSRMPPVPSIYANGQVGAKPILNNPVAPSLADLKELFATQQPAVDIIWKDIYDTAPVLVTATAGSYNFFQSPNTGGSQFSNFKGQGVLPSNQAMVVYDIGLELYNTDTSKSLDAAVIKEFLRTVYIQVQVADKVYADNMGLKFLADGSGVTAATQIYANQPFKAWHLPIYIVIPPQINFFVASSWAATTLAQTTYFKCTLSGVYYRGVQ